MCDDDGFASGWEVMIEARRFQHRLEVFMDQALESLGISFAQYRALKMLDANNEMHVSHLARQVRLSRRPVQATALNLCRTFTADFKTELEEELTHGERHRLTILLRKADRALQLIRPPEWWLAP
jgi:hypothetical protein